MGISGNVEMAPATKSKESPGRKGVATNPVSQKMIKTRWRMSRHDNHAQSSPYIDRYEV